MDLVLQENKAVLSENLVTLLGANPGDRVTIEYSNKDNKLCPVVTLSDSGNKLSKANSFIFKGKDKEFLQQFGTEFDAIKENDTIFLMSNQDFRVYTDVETAVDNYLDISICTDTNYNIDKFSTYTL